MKSLKYILFISIFTTVACHKGNKGSLDNSQREIIKQNHISRQYIYITKYIFHNKELIDSIEALENIKSYDQSGNLVMSEAFDTKIKGLDKKLTVKIMYENNKEVEKQIFNENMHQISRELKKRDKDGHLIEISSYDSSNICDYKEIVERGDSIGLKFTKSSSLLLVNDTFQPYTITIKLSDKNDKLIESKTTFLSNGEDETSGYINRTISTIRTLFTYDNDENVIESIGTKSFKETITRGWMTTRRSKIDLPPSFEAPNEEKNITKYTYNKGILTRIEEETKNMGSVFTITHCNELGLPEIELCSNNKFLIYKRKNVYK